MPRFAIVSNGVVINTIVAESQEIADRIVEACQADSAVEAHSSAEIRAGVQPVTENHVVCEMVEIGSILIHRDPVESEVSRASMVNGRAQVRDFQMSAERAAQELIDRSGK